MWTFVFCKNERHVCDDSYVRRRAIFSGLRTHLHAVHNSLSALTCIPTSILHKQSLSLSVTHLKMSEALSRTWCTAENKAISDSQFDRRRRATQWHQRSEYIHDRKTYDSVEKHKYDALETVSNSHFMFYGFKWESVTLQGSHFLRFVWFRYIRRTINSNCGWY